MGLLARLSLNSKPALPPPDVLTAALCAAELGEPFDFARVPSELFRELLAAMPTLRATVPFAALRLLSWLCNDSRVEVRAMTARALVSFVDVYPHRVEELLLLLAGDTSHKVRRNAAETLACLISASDDPWQLIESWRAQPDRARDVLKQARRSLPHPLGI